MLDPLDYRPPHRDRQQRVTSAERVLAGLVVTAFVSGLIFLIWLLVRTR